jgi:hypothetical protein
MNKNEFSKYSKLSLIRNNLGREKSSGLSYNPDQ